MVDVDPRIALYFATRWELLHRPDVHVFTRDEPVRRGGLGQTCGTLTRVGCEWERPARDQRVVGPFVDRGRVVPGVTVWETVVVPAEKWRAFSPPMRLDAYGPDELEDVVLRVGRALAAYVERPERTLSGAELAHLDARGPVRMRA